MKIIITGDNPGIVFLTEMIKVVVIIVQEDIDSGLIVKNP